MSPAQKADRTTPLRKRSLIATRHRAAHYVDTAVVAGRHNYLFNKTVFYLTVFAFLQLLHDMVSICKNVQATIAERPAAVAA
eukprot:4189517-Pleurochrysis_carterae.AAC.1